MSSEKIIVIGRVTGSRRPSTLPDWNTPVEVRTWGAKPAYTTRRDWGVSFHATYAADFEQLSRPSSKGVLCVLSRPIDSATGPTQQLSAASPDMQYLAQRS